MVAVSDDIAHLSAAAHAFAVTWLRITKIDGPLQKTSELGPPS